MPIPSDPAYVTPSGRFVGKRIAAFTLKPQGAYSIGRYTQIEISMLSSSQYPVVVQATLGFLYVYSEKRGVWRYVSTNELIVKNVAEVFATDVVIWGSEQEQELQDPPARAEVMLIAVRSPPRSPEATVFVWRT